MNEADDLRRSLDRLVALGKTPDVNIRPVLLRVLVDLFIRKAHHSPADLAQFEEISQRLLDEADAETRLIVADKLSRHPAIPKALVERFLAERGSMASSVLEHASLDPDTLAGAAAWGTPDMAVAVARRPDLTPAVSRFLCERPEREVLMTLAGNAAAPLDRPLLQGLVRRARGDDELARILLRRECIAADLAPLFLLASTERRASIILSAHREDLGPDQRRPRLTETEQAALSRVERSLMASDQDSFDIALAAALGLSLEEAWRIIDDPKGEPLAVALTAIGASPEFAARVFILSGPAIGHSVMAVRNLTALVDSLPVRTAGRLMAAMTGQAFKPTRKPEPEAERARPRQAEPEAKAAPQAAMGPLQRRLMVGRHR